MTVLAVGSRSAFQRAFSAALLDPRPSAVTLLALSGLPVLIAAWALMSPRNVLSNIETWDILFNLAGAWHVYLGQVTHVDFHDPVGQLNFILTAIGFKLLGPGVSAFLVNVAIVTAALFVASFLAALRRLPLLPAAIFVVFVCMLALLPTDPGGQPNQYSFAMTYNRYCWSAFSILGLILFVPPRNQRGSDWMDMAIGGVLLVAMFYLKITYFAVGAASLAFAVLWHPHVRRQWLGWSIVGGLTVANALAPYSHPYLIDILASAQDGAVRSSLSPHFNKFFADAGEYAPYIAALVVAGWMWSTGHAALRFPLTIAFLIAAALLLLSQNTQAGGLPSTIVIALMFYDWLRMRSPGPVVRDVMPWLLAILILPLLEVSSFAASIVGYHVKANRTQALYVVDDTNIRGLAVPASMSGKFAAYARDMDYPLRSDPSWTPPPYEISQHEYVVTLLEAADLLKGREPGGIALFDLVNPLPFMLGYVPARGANLWSQGILPKRPAEEYLGDVRYVFIPKFSIDPAWTASLVNLYDAYLAEHFQREVDTKSWTLWVRKRPAR